MNKMDDFTFVIDINMTIEEISQNFITSLVNFVSDEWLEEHAEECGLSSEVYLEGLRFVFRSRCLNSLSAAIQKTLKDLGADDINVEEF